MNTKQLVKAAAKKAYDSVGGEKGWKRMTRRIRVDVVTAHSFRELVALFESGADVCIDPIDILEMNQAIVLETVDLS